MNIRSVTALTLILLIASSWAPDAFAQKRKEKESIPYPPSLPGGERIVTFETKEVLSKPGTIRPGVAVAKTPPKIDLLYYPGQSYPGNPWSVWGDSCATEGKYYSAIGDHLAPGGNAFVYEYDAASKQFKLLADIRKLIDLPDGHYTPGKVHTRVDMARDGRVYFATHRGSTRVTTDEYHYKGDWVIAADPKTSKAEILIHAPVPKHCIPTGSLDPQRLIFYGGAQPGERSGGDKDIQFFAYDVEADKVIYSGPNGPSRYLMISSSTGRVYYTPGVEGKTLGTLVRFDPANPGPPQQIDAELGLRAATDETPQGIIYTVSQAPRGEDSLLYAFNVETEKAEKLGPAAVGTQQYITSIDADPTGRYLYYIPGAHGGSEVDGCPVIQYDTKTDRKKVLAFLHP
ncbi:MAG: hypothetical protein KY475_22995, partial [Planctomycetes bacterium]|nr:hypothetical protein [Planctomycetota bacterium]